MESTESHGTMVTHHGALKNVECGAGVMPIARCRQRTIDGRDRLPAVARSARSTRCWSWAAGAVATRRAAALVEAGARVTVVAPEVNDALSGVEVRQRREYRDGDLDGAWLVLACTSDPAVNAAVAAAAHAASDLLRARRRRGRRDRAHAGRRCAATS